MHHNCTRHRLCGLLVGLAVVAVSVTGYCVWKSRLFHSDGPITADSGPRILHFPQDRSLGMVWLRTIGTEAWKQSARARGEVTIPAGTEADLSIEGDAYGNLALLEGLGSNSLCRVDVKVKDLKDDDLKYIAALPGLRELILSGDVDSPCVFTEEWLRHLSGMRSLRLLNIVGARMTDEDLAHLKAIPSLEDIRLGSIPTIKGPGLQYLADCPKLQGVHLFAMPIGDDALAYLAQINHLRELSISGTEVTEAGLTHLLAGLKELKSLVLPDKTTDSVMQAITPMTGLERLEIDARNMSDVVLARLRNLPRLQSLRIEFARLTPAKAECLRSLPNLRRLELYVRQLEDDDMKLLTGLQSLWSLTAFSQWVTDEGLSNLRDLTGLEYLWLDGMPITDEGLSHLSRLTSLMWLGLSSTKITDKGLVHLKGLTAMRDLNLDNTEVSDVSIELLKTFTSLQGLHVTRAQVTKEGFEQLKAALPLCEVSWQIPPLKLGAPAPPITISGFLQAPAGTVATWEALKGKVVVLEFWATWCGPCVAAMPHINDLVDHFQGKPVQFISITDETAGVAKNFLESHTLKSWVAIDSNYSMGDACHVLTIPYAVVVDGRGIVRARFHPNELTEKTIQALLDE